MTLHEHRRRAFLTIRDLADKADVAVGTIWRIENGKHKHLTVKTMRALASALQVEPGEIREFAAEVSR